MKLVSALKMALVLALLPGGILTGCNTEPDASSEATAQGVTSEQVIGPAAYGLLRSVPAQLVGDWQLTGQECELDSGEIPDIDSAEVTISIRPDFSYVMTNEGRPVPGTFTVNRFKDGSLRLQLADSLLNFTYDDGQLENWSEGDAVYLCGRVFVREK